MADLIVGLQAILTLENFLYMTAGTIIGILAGAIPGLSSTLAISLLVPITFAMDPLPALSMLGGIYNGGMYGGSITACLFNVPGAASAAVTAFDGYPLAMSGKPRRALQLSALSSFVGGVISVAALMFIAPPLAKVVLAFGPGEYFWVAVFGISIVVSLSSESMIKGLIAGLLGMLAAQVGMDPATAFPRYDFGIVSLASGFQLTAVLLGMFSIPSAISLLEEKAGKRERLTEEKEQVKLFSCFKPYWVDYLVSSVIGVVVGIIPAAGGNIASFIAYDTAKKMNKHPEKFGKGAYEGIIASEAANNGVTGGSFIPLLTMGIPGSTSAAAIMGAFMVQGLNLGPQLFNTNTDIVYGLMWAMLITNFIMLFAGFYGAKVITKVLNVSHEVMVPLIFAFSILGCYSSRSNMFDVFVMLAFGVLGYIMKRFGYPASAFILGYILSSILESNLLRVITISQGNLIKGLFGSWLCWLLIIMTVISVASPSIMNYIAKKKNLGDTLEQLEEEE